MVVRRESVTQGLSLVILPTWTISTCCFLVSCVCWAWQEAAPVVEESGAVLSYRTETAGEVVVVPRRMVELGGTVHRTVAVTVVA